MSAAEPPASTPPPTPIPAEELRAWMARRRRGRSRIKAALAVVLSLAVAVFAVFWTFFHAQYLASGSLGALGFTVEWDLNFANLTAGGTTSVLYSQRFHSSFNDLKAADLAPLRSLSHIVRLELVNLQHLKDEDLTILADLPDLEDLDLSRHSTPYGYYPGGISIRVALTDRVLDYIAGHRKIKFLSLADDKITDAGAAKLANLSELETLDLDNTLITDAGLESLKRLKKLRFLRIVNTGVTPEGVARFQRDRSDVEVTSEDIPLSELSR